ncbi:MAG: AAA family ATPase [Planctomycetales bacterium]|nr:AAA family ATPase [Planctomycetales bacterium]
MAHEDQLRDGLLATILADESFRPTEPQSVEDTGLPVAMIEALVCKRLSLVGISSGRKIADSVCLPFRVLEDVYHSMRNRQILVHKGSAPLNDYNYTLTEQGRERAQIALAACAYSGPAPVPLMDYVLSAEAQTIRAETPKREQLRAAFKSISIHESLFESLGPAINSGAGLFLYGEPGNGKSTLAKCITMCFGQQVWIPHAFVEDGQIVKVYDASFHESATSDEDRLLASASYDRRWVKVRRPTVVVGGELTMDSLEIRHDPLSNVSEAPLQLKSNCGCLLIDDFGRQRIEPTELLNRWIIPLENRVDYLTLSTGKKIQVPFEQLIIFSTNLEPSDLVDEAFLRRIPYKIAISDPSPEEFHHLFKIYSQKFDCEYRPGVVNHLIETHYRRTGLAMRRCHPRDLLGQIRNYCVYNHLPMEMRNEYFDRVVRSYFTVVLDPDAAKTPAQGVTRRQPGPAKAPPAMPPEQLPAEPMAP